MKYLLSERYTDKRSRPLLLADDFSILMKAAQEYLAWIPLSDTSFETRQMTIEGVPEVEDLSSQPLLS